LLPPFPSSPRGEPAPVPHWEAEEAQSTAGGGRSSPEAEGSLIFAALCLGRWAWDPAAVCPTWSALEYFKETKGKDV